MILAWCIGGVMWWCQGLICAWWMWLLKCYCSSVSILLSTGPVWNKLSQKCFVSLLKHNLSPSSWAPKARSEAWEVYPWELYPPDDPPRPSRPKAGVGPSWTKCGNDMYLQMIFSDPMLHIVDQHWGGHRAQRKHRHILSDGRSVVKGSLKKIGAWCWLLMRYL